MHRRSKGLHESSDCNAPKIYNPCDWTINRKKLFKALRIAHDHRMTQLSDDSVDEGWRTNPNPGSTSCPDVSYRWRLVPIGKKPSLSHIADHAQERCTSMAWNMRSGTASLDNCAWYSHKLRHVCCHATIRFWL